MTRPEGGLGRGLGALIPSGPTPGVPGAVAPAPVPGARFAELPLEAITPNPLQPRQNFDAEAMAELVTSIQEIGLLQPVVVRPLPAVADGSPDGAARYELVMGERRWRASREAGLTAIPAIIRETPDDDMLRDALLENLHRQELNPLEEAAAYQQLLADFGATHEELAARIGRSRPQITNTIRLLQLPAPVQSRVAAGVLSAGHARAMLGLPTAEAQEAMATRVVAEGMSVRAVEEAVALARHDGDAVPAPRPHGRREQPAELMALADRLSDRFDTRVKVDLGRSKGKVTIEFASMDDLHRIMEVLEGEQTPQGAPQEHQGSHESPAHD